MFKEKEIFLNRFIKSSILVVIGQIISQGIGFASLAIVARYIPREDFGVFVIILIIINFFIMLGNLGLDNTVVKFLSSSPEEQKTILSSSLGLRIVIGCIFFVFILFFGKFFNIFFHSSKLQAYILFIAIFFTSEYIFQLFQSFLQGLHLYRKLTWVQILGSIARLSLILCLVLYFKQGVLGLLISYLLVSLFSCAISYLFMPWTVIPQVNFNVVKRILSFGFPLQINQFLSFVFERTDSIMLGSMIGASSVASYEVGYKIPEWIRNIFISFHRVYYPHISELYSKNENEFAERFLNKLLRLVSLTVAILALFFGLFSKEIITGLFSIKYVSSSIVLTLIMIRINVGLCNYLMSTALIASGRPKAILLSSALEAIINIGANFLFIPRFGVLGAASATLISTALVNPVFLMQSNFNRLSIWWAYFRSILSLIICLGIFYLIPGMSLLNRLSIILIFIMLTLLFKTILPKEVHAYLSSIKTALHITRVKR